MLTNVNQNNQMMFKNLILILAIVPFSIFSQEATDSIKINRILDQVNVNALRANKTTPIAFTNISKEELKKELKVEELKQDIFNEEKMKEFAKGENEQR